MSDIRIRRDDNHYKYCFHTPKKKAQAIKVIKRIKKNVLNSVSEWWVGGVALEKDIEIFVSCCMGYLN